MPDAIDQPKKRPPTSGTRRGNGQGWGGAAQGAGKRGGPVQAPFEAGNQAARGYHDMSRSERLAALDERKWKIAMGEVTVEPVQLAALNSYEDRHEGKPGQSVKLQGDAEHPVEIVYSWADAPAAE